jgi:hypothetical protein
MNRQILFALIAVFLLTGAAFAQNRNVAKSVKKTPPKKVINYIQDQEEYAVYEAVLRETFPHATVGQTIVLNKEVTGCGTVIDNEVEMVISRTVLEELFQDCYAKKWGNYELVANNFPSQDKIVLVSEKDLEPIFNANCDVAWRRFYKKFPSAKGNTSFSRIGFNSQRNFAVVNFGSQSACLASSGRIIFLEKENEVWKVKKSQTTWSSE